MERRIDCRWEEATVTLGMEEAGSGASVVLLPALSSISTRGEMRPLFDRLKSDFHVSTVDWPGFGDLPRTRADWSPDSLSAFLNWFLNEVSPGPHTLVAAGHAATYALYHTMYRSESINRLVLIAPTWRGPLPTMIGAYRPWFAQVRRALDLPIFGELLYRLNVSRFVMKKMAREHVYSDPDWLSGDRLSAKLAVTRARGARYASVRFVSGYLDRVASRESFVTLVRKAAKPTLIVYGDETPARSRAEIESLPAPPNLRTERLPRANCPSTRNSRTKSFLLSDRFFSRERALSARLRPLAKANIRLIADHITYITRASRIRRAGAARDH